MAAEDPDFEGPIVELEGRFMLVVHHGGVFFEFHNTKYIGKQTVLEAEPDYWSYFSLLATIKKLGGPMITSLWYHDPYLEENLIRLRDDNGCRRMQDIAEMDKMVHLYVIHFVDPRAFGNLNPLDEANDFPVPNAGVALEEIVDDMENGGVLMIEYPVVVEENGGNVVDMVENEGNVDDMHENELRG
ncbi:hypothetical protein MtrunA17_Chr4g0049811 [Medicago truncatula]|uniref:PB1-like domain-containing protein n=1 Tax=Medicago truncatula TaxID=3880 RepID=A0A396IAN1_MEDTR|nr:hypothetical protein MtrunA17_Chr4g0049811 [Medicago truncatula]